MEKPVRILLVEDNRDDMELLQIQLNKLQLEFELDVLDQKRKIFHYLDTEDPDLIICDYNLPGFTGLDVLNYVREQSSELPFILVSGYIGEEKAVDAMRMGASDSVLKDNLERLCPVAERELIHFREFKKTERERDQAIGHLEERVKEQRCLYNISRLEDQKLNINELLQNAVSFLPAGFKYPEITEASIEYAGKTYQTPGYVDTEWYLKESTEKTQESSLLVSVIYLEQMPDLELGPFMKEEQHLIESVADILSLKINRILDQQELERKQELLEKTYDLAQIGNWEVDLVDSCVYWSSTTKKIHEVAEDFEPDLERAINFYKEGEDRDRISNLVELAIEEGKTFDTELRIITAKGNEKWIRAIGEPEFEKGKCIRIFGSFQDIDKRKKAEEEITKREQRFRSMVQDGADIIAIVDAKGDYQYVAPTKIRAQKMGWEPEEFYGKSIYDILHPDYHDLLKESIHSIGPGESVMVEPFKYAGRNDEWRWMESTITNLTKNPAIDGYVTNSRDVTERIEQERKLQEILENMTNLFYRGNLDFEISYVSPQSWEFFGCSPEAAKEKLGFFKTDHPENQKAVEIAQKAIEDGNSPEPYELELEKVTGEKIWVEVNEAPVIEDGEPVAIVGSLTDITQRKKYKEKLEELSLVASKTTDVILITDAEERITWVNKAYTELTGYTLEESLGKVPGDFLQGPDTDTETVHRVSIAIDNNQTSHETILNYAKDGSKYWLDMKIDPIFEDGECTGFIAIERDVTAKREAYERLAATERKLREIVEHSTNLFFKHDGNHQLEYISPQSYDFIGLKPEQAMKKWTELVTDHPVNEIGFQKTVNAIETGEQQGPYELQFRHMDGSIVWARVHEAPVVEDGETVAIVGSLTDITEEKKYEEKLEELSQIAAKTTDLILVADTNQRITWVNQAFEELTGYSLEESIGKLPSELLFGPESNKETVRRIDKKLDAFETVNETIQIVSKKGEKYWMDTTIDSVFDEEKNFTRYITIQKDVTEKIKKENALKESLKRYDIVTKATSDVIWDADLETDTLTYNSNIYEVFGYDIDEVQNSDEWWVSHIHPDDRERVYNEFKNAELGKEDRVQVEYRYQCADGSYKYINDRAYILNDEDGNPIRMIGAMQDVTKQKEENLWLKLMESAVANTSESIVILEGEPTDLPGRKILYANRAFEEMTGYLANEAIGETLQILNGPETSSKERKKLRGSIENHEPHESEFINYKKDGSSFWVHVSFAPVLDSDGHCSHWIVVGRDVTERRERVKALEESLNEKETLLMEIHHRVKNNLAVVSSMMQLQAMKEEDESLQKKLYDSVTRIRTMVSIHELLYESGSFSKLDFGKNLKKLVSTIIETLKSDYKLTLNYSMEDIQLNVNQAIPTSLIVNEIVTNSIKHAFNGSKEGTIDLVLDEKENQVRIQITDNGVGLPEDFDLKDTSSLGLQLINILSQQLNASYEYKTSEKGGTIFEIQFEKNEIKGMGNVHL